jgi:hypothetical protein
MAKVIKTTFEEEQKEKDEAFLKLSPLERLEKALQIRKKMRKRGVDYSYKGLRVKITRL